MRPIKLDAQVFQNDPVWGKWVFIVTSCQCANMLLLSPAHDTS